MMLRFKVATNHFKQLLLGDLHLPGKAQEVALFEELQKCNTVVGITSRSWSDWFANPNIIPKVGKVKTLDKLASSKVQLISRNCFKDKTQLQNYFLNMIHGGLVSEMLQSSKSKHPLTALKARADNYLPDSTLHLHLDAIEICALSDGYGDIPWETVKQVGAERILKLLTNRWGPRKGTVFSELTSDLQLKWDAASPVERIEIRKSIARFKPDLFERNLVARAIPDWNITGIEADASPLHIYKVLFSLAADTKFLVADRLEIWSLDLATAALAMHALAWSDRYTTFDQPISDELIFWCAFDDLFFSQEAIDSDNQDFVGAMTRCNAEWSMDSFEVFLQARNIYQNELKDLGISENDVISTAMQATSVHPLIYKA